MIQKIEFWILENIYDLKIKIPPPHNPTHNKRSMILESCELKSKIIFEQLLRRFKVEWERGGGVILKISFET